MKAKYILLSALVAVMLNANSSFALIKLDDDSINLAIRYGIKMKGSLIQDILSSNWLNDGSGRILNIYSPFMQLALKASDKGTSGNPDQDVKNLRISLKQTLSKIQGKNEVRFIVSLYGDTEDFAKHYTAYIIDGSSLNQQKTNMIKPKKSSNSKVADKDGFNPEHPYSAVNSYNFKFNDVSKLKDYSFVLVSEKGEQIKYRLNNKEIF